ncbi:MAG: BlaI/MecI/CopY family transcriptional regulator [Methanimicrococcus sp.]|nr:BlaI/MecI/CopY family transcriptional regulator [Methanimicrococcus sp.]
MKLPNAEEHLIKIIWKCETAFLKDIMEHYPDPKPALTTVATLLKRLQDRGMIAYRLFGNSRQYYPLVAKEDYFSKYLNDIVKNFFGNSALQFASFFTSETNLSTEELKELRNLIDTEIKKKNR